MQQTTKADGIFQKKKNACTFLVSRPVSMNEWGFYPRE